MTTRQISTVIMDNLLLDLHTQFDIQVADEQAGVIKIGRLQDDPEAARISITVHPTDPDAPDKWTDTVFARRDDALDRSQFEAQTWEVGSRGSVWWRRGAVEWSWFGTKTGETREEAQRKAGLVEARVQQAIDHSVYVPGCKDDFGEITITLMSVVSSKSEGGGPPNSFIWRGKVLWQALTQRS